MSAQLAPKEINGNLVYLNKNSYELNDNVLPFLGFLKETQEGEYYTLGKVNINS